MGLLDSLWLTITSSPLASAGMGFLFYGLSFITVLKWPRLSDYGEVMGLAIVLVLTTIGSIFLVLTIILFAKSLIPTLFT